MGSKAPQPAPMVPRPTAPPCPPQITLSSPAPPPKFPRVSVSVTLDCRRMPTHQGNIDTEGDQRMSIRDEAQHVAAHLPASALPRALKDLIEFMPESWVVGTLKLLCQVDADAREPATPILQTDRVGGGPNVARVTTGHKP